MRYHEQRVLNANAETSFQIDAGFVGNGHAGVERCGPILHTNLVRTLVYVQEGAHTVTCSMQVVQTLLP